VGLIGAIELVADKAQRRNFDPALKIAPRLVKHGEAEGLILRALPNDGIAFSPPLVITAEEIGEVLDRFGRALDALSVELRREALVAV
jgi:4-aminobutyrate--pyruvate transaminase